MIFQQNNGAGIRVVIKCQTTISFSITKSSQLTSTEIYAYPLPSAENDLKSVDLITRYFFYPIKIPFISFLYVNSYDFKSIVRMNFFDFRFKIIIQIPCRFE